MPYIIPITFTLFVHVGEAVPVNHPGPAAPGAGNKPGQETPDTPKSAPSYSVPDSPFNINLNIIQHIGVSENDKKKVGVYQITNRCISAFNTFGPGKTAPYLRLCDMTIDSLAREIAEWYLNVRIPLALAAYHIQDSIEHRLVCYSAGTIYLLHKKPLPKDTIKYIEKYHDLKDNL